MSHLKKLFLNLELLGVTYLITIGALFFYSFTQVDLGLTLSQFSLWQVVEKFFQHIGYFNRPLSTALYIVIVLVLFIFYGIFIKLTYEKKVEGKQIWTILIIAGGILLFSYNAFSYDLFNYMFDAKIVTYYHQNPYEHKALDYPGDPMLSFMRWTHRVYPYGPVWLLLTIPLSFLEFKFFLPTFFLFKSLMVGSFLGTAFLINKIVRKVSPGDELLSVVFFGLNPLVIIESLVSSHNDITMMFFALTAFYFLIVKRHVLCFLFLLLSIGVKFATLFLLPVFVLTLFYQHRKKAIPWSTISFLLILAMIPSILGASLRTNFQPWYLLFVLPFAAVLSKKSYIAIASVVTSFFGALWYIPYLYLGNWDPPVTNILSAFLILGIGLPVGLVLLWKFLPHKF